MAADATFLALRDGGKPVFSQDDIADHANLLALNAATPGGQEIRLPTRHRAQAEQINQSSRTQPFKTGQGLALGTANRRTPASAMPTAALAPTIGDGKS